MDTQGTFDNSTTQKECATIFSLSTFLSSILIYNIKNQIQKTDLEYLTLFTQFKQLSDKKFASSFKLNQLSFLIRDWQFPDEYSYGFEGGEKLLTVS
jgi:atlastin